MKNIIGAILIACGVALGMMIFLNSATMQLNDNTIYFFTKPGCPYCDKASDYIKQMHPDLVVEYKNVKEISAQNLMMACAEKFGLPKNRLGTPLICMGNNHILGWSDASVDAFEQALKAMK